MMLEVGIPLFPPGRSRILQEHLPLKVKVGPAKVGCVLPPPPGAGENRALPSAADRQLLAGRQGL